MAGIGAGATVANLELVFRLLVLTQVVVCLAEERMWKLVASVHRQYIRHDVPVSTKILAVRKQDSGGLRLEQ